MKLTTQDKIRLGFSLLSILPVVLGILAWRTTTNLIRSIDEVHNTNRVIAHLGTLIAGLKDVEVAQREFILTGDDKYVKEFQRHRDTFDKDIDHFVDLTKDNQRHRPWVENLRFLVREKFHEIERTIRVRRDSGFEAASQVVLTNQGSRAMDDIAVVMRNLRREEDSRLAMFTAREHSSVRSTITLFAVIMLANVGILWFVWYLMKRDQAERQREQQRMRLLNVELERRVEERTLALRHSNEELQQFAYVVSHDLQEPLRMVSNYTELLQRRYKGQLDQDADTFIGFAVDGTKRMSRLIQDLLEYARVSSVRDENIGDVDTRSALDSALSNLQARIEETGAIVTHEGLPAVRYETTRLSQIFQNLVGNALKYRGEQRPRVQITATRQGGDFVFAVKDNGIGISPQHQDKIFGVFQRLHGREYEGTGIGLAMVKRIVERHGGRIWVESKPGEGSTFYFTVPDHGVAKVAGAA